MVRPSGTEPVLKCYLEAVVPVRSGDLARARERCEARLADVGPALEALLRH
jgi:phosphomannomutase